MHAKKMILIALRSLLAVCIIVWAFILMPELLPRPDGEAASSAAAALAHGQSAPAAGQPDKPQDAVQRKTASGVTEASETEPKSGAPLAALPADENSESAPAKKEPAAAAPQSAAVPSASTAGGQTAATAVFSISSLETYPG